MLRYDNPDGNRPSSLSGVADGYSRCDAVVGFAFDFTLSEPTSGKCNY